MILLFGTTNEAKLTFMIKALRGLPIELLGLKSMKTAIPHVFEIGESPLENARLKAMAYYKAFGVPVFSCDTGLYFDNVPDEIQPGIHVRRINGKELTDAEMTQYYANLANEYGDLVARYKNAVCLVKDMEHIYECMDDSLSGNKFIVTKIPHPKRIAGFPIDCLAKDIKSGNYYYDTEACEDAVVEDNGFREFFLRCL